MITAGFESIDDVLVELAAVTSLAVVVESLDATSDRVLSKQWTVDGVDSLDVAITGPSSIVTLYILISRITSVLSKSIDAPDVRQNIQHVFSRLLGFIERCDPQQVRAAPHKVKLLGEVMYRLGVSFNKFDIVAGPIVNLTMRLSVTGQLSTLHPIAMRICLLARCFQEVLPILQSEISDVNPRIFGIRVQDLLLYMYYGGMIYAALKEHTKAMEFFGMAVSTPTQGCCSRIQIEAYKKYIFMSLMAHGKVLPFRRNVSAIVTRTFKTHCKIYLDFGAAFQPLNYFRALKELRRHETLFAQDQNLGLAKQCLNYVHRLMIRELTNTYLTLSLANIGKLMAPKRADTAIVESIIVDMIASGTIHATIDQQNGMVVFADAEEYISGNALQHSHTLEKHLHTLTALSNRVKTMERTMSSSYAYISKLSRGGEHAALEQARYSSMREIEEMDYD